MPSRRSFLALLAAIPAALVATKLAPEPEPTLPAPLPTSEVDQYAPGHLVELYHGNGQTFLATMSVKNSDGPLEIGDRLVSDGHGRLRRCSKSNRHAIGYAVCIDEHFERDTRVQVVVL